MEQAKNVGSAFFFKFPARQLHKHSRTPGHWPRPGKPRGAQTRPESPRSFPSIHPTAPADRPLFRKGEMFGVTCSKPPEISETESWRTLGGGPNSGAPRGESTKSNNFSCLIGWNQFRGKEKIVSIRLKPVGGRSTKGAGWGGSSVAGRELDRYVPPRVGKFIWNARKPDLLA